MTALPVDVRTGRHLVDAAAASIAEAHWRLQNAFGGAAALADIVDWQTPSARAFHEQAELLRTDVARLVDSADTARDHVWWARSTLESLAIRTAP
jgi:hypothetical protein